MTIRLMCCALLIGAALVGGGARAETLHDALAKAYATSPDLRNARANLRAVDERIAQALSGWRPSASISGSGGVGRANSSNVSEQTLLPASGDLEIVQPLYTGGQTEAAVRRAENQILSGRADLRSAQQNVLLNAVSAYMDVRRDQARLDLNRNNEEVLSRQLQATEDRFEVGEVTRTDVAQAEARLSRAEADRIQAEGVLAVSRATYERVVGEAPVNLEPPPPLPPLPVSLSEALDIALEENPDLESAGYDERAADSAVEVAFSTLLPRVDLQGRLTGSHETSLEDVSSDSATLLARVTIPLYQSGIQHSRVRESKELHNQARIQVEQARRAVIERVTQAWEVLTSTQSNIEARAESVRANEIALEGVREEASVGSRTTLDVLDAEQEYLDARVALVDAERDRYVAGFTLLSAIGRLSVEQLDVDVQPYDPVPHYSRVRDTWWGWEVVE